MVVDMVKMRSHTVAGRRGHIWCRLWLQGEVRMVPSVGL